MTVFFWVIKILCTTVGETAADFLNVNLNLGLTLTSVVMAGLLVISLIIQFRRDRYVPWVYWLAVALISVVGTLVTDNLTDNLGVPLEISTVVFSVVLAGVFTWWYRGEGTLSIHSIVTRRREGFYWLAILFTFALGTAAGDLMAEVLGLGYLVSGIIVVSLVAITAIAWRLGLDSVLAFWIIYVLTRPLGASIGDYLSQPAGHGGVGLGATGTSVLFTAAIIALVTYLSVSKADTPDTPTASATADPEMATPHRALVQTIVVVALVLIGAGIGYPLRKAALTAPPEAAPTAGSSGQSTVRSGGNAAAVPSSPLGDLSQFATISQDTLNLLNAGKQAAATTRITDLETAWDDAEATLRPKNPSAWKDVDTKIDTVLRALRSTHPNPATEKTTLTTLLATLGTQPTAGAPPVAARSPLGDLSQFTLISQDTLNLLNVGKQSAATARITDLETAWDDAEATLRPKDPNAWKNIDIKIDTVLRALRSTHPNLTTEKTTLATLLASLR